MNHLLSTTTLSIGEIMDLLKDANDFSRGKQWKPEEQTFIANLFFEPSTRTKSSFEMAERKLRIRSDSI